MFRTIQQRTIPCVYIRNLRANDNDFATKLAKSLNKIIGIRYICDNHDKEQCIKSYQTQNSHQKFSTNFPLGISFPHSSQHEMTLPKERTKRREMSISTNIQFKLGVQSEIWDTWGAAHDLLWCHHHQIDRIVVNLVYPLMIHMQHWDRWSKNPNQFFQAGPPCHIYCLEDGKWLRDWIICGRRFWFFFHQQSNAH